MLKTLDLFMINTILMLLAFVWTYFIVKNIFYAILISIAIYIFVWCLIKVIKKNKTTNYSSQKLAKHFALMGNKYTASFINSIVNVENKEIINDSYILLKEKNEIIVPIIKFSNLGYENIANIYRTAKNLECNKIYIIYSNIDRNAMVLANGLNIKCEFISIDYLFNYLKKSDKLPVLDEFSEKPINKISLKILIKAILNRKNTKYYIFTGVLFLLLSLITPLQVYYATVTTISFMLALLTFLPIDIKINFDTKNEENNSSFANLLQNNKESKVKQEENEINKEPNNNKNNKSQNKKNNKKLEDDNIK